MVGQRRPGKIHEALLNQKKDYQALEAKRREMQLQHCSFQPKIDKKSEKIVKVQRDQQRNAEYIQRRTQAQLEKARKLMQEKEENEMNECTFAPKLVSKRRPKSRAAINANVEEESPDSRINRPEQSIMTSKMAPSHRSREESYGGGNSQALTSRSYNTTRRPTGHQQQQPPINQIDLLDVQHGINNVSSMLDSRSNSRMNAHNQSI